MRSLGEFNGRRLSTGLRLNYRFRLWARTSASRAISALLVCCPALQERGEAGYCFHWRPSVCHS